MPRTPRRRSSSKQGKAFKPMDMTNDRKVQRFSHACLLLESLSVRRQFKSYLDIRERSSTTARIEKRMKNERVMQIFGFALIIRLKNKLKKAYQFLKKHSEDSKLRTTSLFVFKMHQIAARKLMRCAKAIIVSRPKKRGFIKWYCC